MQYQHKCVRCHKEFENNNVIQKYCSRLCYLGDCGKEIWGINYQPKDEVYKVVRGITPLGLVSGNIFEKENDEYIPKDTFGQKIFIPHARAYTKSQIELLTWSGVLQKLKI